MVAKNRERPTDTTKNSNQISLSKNLTCQVISIFNLKGGVGKTSITSNIAALLARKKGFKVLAIDLDSQSQLGMALGAYHEVTNTREAEKQGKSIVNVLFDNVDALDAITHSDMGCDLLLGSPNIIHFDEEFANLAGSEYILTEKLSGLRNHYDLILFDNPPNLSKITINSLKFSDYLLIPVIPNMIDVIGFLSLLNELEYVVERYGKIATLLGVCYSRVESTNVVKESMKYLFNTYADNPATIFSTVIRKNTSVPEAFAVGVDVNTYKPSCVAAKNFMSLANEIVARISPKLLGVGDYKV